MKMSPRDGLELKLFTGLSMPGYQLVRSKLPRVIPPRNHLNALAKTLVPRWMRADSEGAHALPMELIRQTAQDLLTLTTTSFGYVVLWVKAGVDGAGNFNIWRRLRSKEVDMENILMTALVPLGMDLVTGQPPFSDDVLKYIGKNVKKEIVD